MFAGGGNFPKAENFQNAGRSAGQKSGRIIEEKFSEIHRMETIDILGRGDVAVNEIMGKPSRQGGLNENAVDFRVGVEGVDLPQEGGKGGVFRKHEGATGDADLPGAFLLAGDIGPGGWILTHANENQSGSDSQLTELLHPLGSLLVDLGGKSFPVEKSGRHAERMPWSFKKWKGEERLEGVKKEESVDQRQVG